MHFCCTARAALVAVTTDRQILEQKIASQQARAEETELGLAAWEMNGNDDETVGEDRQLKSNIVGYPESDDEDNSKVCEVESLPSELMELKRQLNYLRNEFSQVTEAIVLPSLSSFLKLPQLARYSPDNGIHCVVFTETFWDFLHGD